MPVSNEVAGGRLASDSPIPPRAVREPVRQRRTRAVPLITEVPMKTAFPASARASSAAAETPGCFSTG